MKRTTTPLVAAMLALGALWVCMQQDVSAAPVPPNCSTACRPWRPCDKICVNDVGDYSTCGSEGLPCDEPTPEPGPSPTPEPTPDPCPQPTFTMNKTAPRVGVEITFTADAAKLLDPPLLSWNWGDGSSCDGCGAQENHAFEEGTYTIQFEGWDRCDKLVLSKSKTITVTVKGGCVGAGCVPMDQD